MTSPPALPTDHKRRQLLDAVKENTLLLFGIVAIAWGLEILDTILFGSLDQFGVRPRSIFGLSGIVFAPFLHGGFGHLISNTLPFLVLGGVVLIGGKRLFQVVSIFIVGVGGGMLWVLGPAYTNHIGASLLIFGYLGFLLARGIFERSAFWILVSIITLSVYGSMIFGILPGQQGISWQGHLFGFVSGILAARVLAKPRTAGQIT